MLKIYKDAINEIYRHVLKESPLEACGYLAGRNNIVYKNYAMTNIDKSKEHFAMDINEQFIITREVRSEDFKIKIGQNKYIFVF